MDAGDPVDVEAKKKIDENQTQTVSISISEDKGDTTNTSNVAQSVIDEVIQIQVIPEAIKQTATKPEGIAKSESREDSNGSVSEIRKSTSTSFPVETDPLSIKAPQEVTLEPEVIGDEDEFTIYHCVSYLGASTIKEPRSETEIHKTMTFLNEQSSDEVIQVSVSVPLYSDGQVIVYEEDSQLEISRFGVSQIIFFARGLTGTPDWACFAFTCSHGESPELSIFQCHVFRCDVPEAVGRVFASFARTFTSPARASMTNSVTGLSSSETEERTSIEPSSLESSMFEVSLEIKEDDGKGNYSAAPRDKGFFKLRSCVAKHIVLTVQQIPEPGKDLIVERCFGLLLSPGRYVQHSDMQLVEMLSWSIGSQGQDRKSYVITGHWDQNDPAFESLNRETAKDSYIFFTVAVDLVIKGIQEPIRFALETKAKIYPATERFWMIVRKHHFTQQFILSLKRAEGTKPGEIVYQLVSNTPCGEVERSKVNFNLNFTSFIRSSSIHSIDLETPTKEEEETDDDEPLQSGMGEVSKHCTDELLTAWSELVSNWPATAPARPKNLASLVRNGIPDTIRGEMWLRLSGYQNDSEMMNTYRTLLSKECPNEDIILRDITRTFPANDYFRESGGGQELLYKISKGYAIYDTDVGYCQGLSFIAAALLLQMPEEQSFCLLVKIMYDYEFRDLFRDGFDNLRLKLYQLDRLVEEQIPEIWAHFQELGIESHMYANQWFLTLYTAKFPLVFVFRVIDLFLLDGIKVLFQIALALLTAARKDLLMLDFEGVLKYFRVTLPKKYRNVENTSSVMRLTHQMKVKRLKRFGAEYAAIKEQEKNYVDPIERLQAENKKLMEDMIRSEHLITKLVLAEATALETTATLEEELQRTSTSLKEVEDFNQKLKEETNSVKELFQREVKQYDIEAEKKSNIIAEYKRICSKLSRQLDEEQKVSRERTSFFQSNLCEGCSTFVLTALAIAANKQNGTGIDSGSSSPSGGANSAAAASITYEEALLPLENELAKTKIALAEAECRNDDLGHQLGMALTELEICKNSHGLSGPSRIWKSLPFNKDNKRASVHTPSEETAPSQATSSSYSSNSINTLGVGNGGSSSGQIPSSSSMQGFSKK